MLWPIAIGGVILAGFLLSTASANAAVDAKLDYLTPSRRRKGARDPIFDFHIRVVPYRTFIRKNKETGKEEEIESFRQEVMEPPAQLAERASQVLGRKIPIETFALATLAASEAGNGPDIAKVAVMHAALTQAKRERKTLMKLLAPDGKFGGQQGRYAATRQPPTVPNIELAEAVVRNQIDNPVPGAFKWDSPAGQRKALEKKIPGYTKTPEQVADDRHAEHLVEAYVPGVDREYLRLWKPAAAA